MKGIFGRGHPARAEPAVSCAMLQRRSIQLHGPSRGFQGRFNWYRQGRDEKD
jgi:hypothetical protein